MVRREDPLPQPFQLIASAKDDEVEALREACRGCSAARPENAVEDVVGHRVGGVAAHHASSGRAASFSSTSNSRPVLHASPPTTTHRPPRSLPLSPSLSR